jgi:hypothetical protein
MKKKHVTDADRMDWALVGSIAFSVIQGAILIGMLVVILSGCSSAKPSYRNNFEPKWITDPTGWSEFVDCVADEPTDAVCDSCYFAVFGEH